MNRFSSLVVVSVAVATVLFCATWSQAQQAVRITAAQGGAVQAYAMFPSVPGFYMLQTESVQKEIELVPEQAEKLKEIGKKYYEGMRQDWSGIREMSLEERTKKIAEVREVNAKRMEDVRKQIEEVLLPHQLQALKDIDFRTRAPYTLQSPMIQGQLGLNDEQKERLTKIRQEQVDKQRELQKAMFEKALDVLTKEQQDKLRELTTTQGSGGGAYQTIQKP